MKICALTPVWNCKMWLPYSIRGIYDFVDSIVISEACWVPDPSWLGNESPDGSADIIRKFIKEEDTENKVRFHQAGLCKSQPEARNSGLHLVPEDTDWVIMFDCDEFYFKKDLILLRKVIENPMFKQYGSFSVPAKCFYFTFKYFTREPFTRGYRWFPGQHFWAIASMLNPSNMCFDMGKLGIEFYHGSYVGKEYTKIKACIDNDLPKSRYDTWYENIFSKFNGTNLEELYKNNKDGIHVNGGSKLERYDGPYPESLLECPMINYKWENK